MSHIGELMAVELEHSTERLLFVPLAAQAAGNVVNVLVEHVNLRLVVKGLVAVCNDLALILLYLLRICLKIVLSLSDALCQPQNFQSEGLDRDNLIRVDIDLLFVAVLISEGLLKVEIVNGIVVIFWHDRTIIAFPGFGFCSCLGCYLGRGLSLSLDFDLALCFHLNCL